MASTNVHCPIAFGSIAFWLGRKADDELTHRWTLFLRGPNGEDLSYFVSKVVFTLHPSFAQPVREILEPPFEVTEMGWGEFEASMRLFFQDPRETPVDIVHTIKLYPPGNLAPSMKKPVVHEFYDEIVFTDPSDAFYQAMVQGSQRTCVNAAHADHLTLFSDVDDVQNLLAAQQTISDHLRKTKDDILKLEAEKMALQSTCRSKR